MASEPAAADVREVFVERHVGDDVPLNRGDGDAINVVGRRLVAHAILVFIDVIIQEIPDSLGEHGRAVDGERPAFNDGRVLPYESLVAPLRHGPRVEHKAVIGREIQAVQRDIAFVARARRSHERARAPARAAAAVAAAAPGCRAPASRRRAPGAPSSARPA